MMKVFIVGILLVLLSLFEYTQCIQLKNDIGQLGSTVGELHRQVDSLKIEGATLEFAPLIINIFLRLISMLIFPGLMIFFLLWFHVSFFPKPTIKRPRQQLSEEIRKIVYPQK